MNVKVEKLENNVVKLEISVDSAKFNEGIKKAYKKNAKQFNIPGFRKGKAPMNVIKKFYGEGVFFEDAINFCCDETYPAAVEEAGITPVDYPKIDVVEIGEGKDFIYTAEVVVTPEVKLGEYKGIEAEKNTYEVTEEEIEGNLKAKAEQNARTVEKNDGEVVDGDIVTIDFKGSVDGVEFEGGTAEDYELTIGSKSFIDNFEEQLIGAKVGEEKEVNVTFPENYGRDDLNNKPAKFEVKIKAIKAKELPEIDDEFIKDVSEFDTVEEYKNDLRAKLEKSNTARAEREFEEALLEKVIANAEIDIPEVMIEREIDHMVKDLEMRLQYQGLDLETYYKYTNNTAEKVREMMKENAEKKVMSSLVLSEIAKVENIEVSEEEAKEKALEIAKQYGGEKAEETAELIIKTQGAMLNDELKSEKVVKLIVDNSKVTA
ncbi:trigger factor [Oceanirhabdus sp. W0125-5]|uniref:trigger factor n=1 Tax=Oceanirhabdus sp. W0125-5 TaxID=2999116 RepID=UPI0022F2AF38|nr:trigger factor [Oceanirhabdus sp. W0125-5]WBW98912.1 trigger factor [Oceanirhabdus sp. W0125-5]